jgi:hypothetical protein
MKPLFGISSLVLMIVAGHPAPVAIPPDPMIIRVHLPSGYPDPDGKIQAWMVRQKNMNGGSCCDPNDHTAILENEQWKIDVDHYSVKVNGVWVSIPPYTLLLHRDTDPNPTGKGVLWSGFNRNMPGQVVIYCFAPGTGT